MGNGKTCGTRSIERIRSGIDGLDKLTEGGFVKNSTIMVQGGTGTGKTIFCLQYLYNGAKDYDEPGIYISFSENEKAMLQHGRSFCWDLEGLEKKNRLVIMRYEPHEMVSMVAEGGGSLRDTFESIGAKRIVIDSLSAYQLVFESEYKANESVLELLEMLRKWEATSVVTAETSVSVLRDNGGKLGFLTDGILNLYYERDKSGRKRALEIIKMRDTSHDMRLLNFDMGMGGIKIKGEMMKLGRY